MDESKVIIFSILGGALGGLASFMWVAYSSFEKIPTVDEAKEMVEKHKRKMYMGARVTFGILVAFMFSFWFMDSVVAGEISGPKLIFYSSLIGFSTGFLPAVAQGFQKAAKKVMSKFGG
ncbi:hypothetical protein [Rheinheimera sp. 1928-s]|uniref:hypothetical protein n=1 Tax=Rheinheimera sp. 1928-s TaxID=3033803 RepID=UPI002601D8B0|nr:hypothetical protein [Rheinheimera sp. 1928-s]MDF3124737.1 hypothetical protein [Rheinheimera sp. 1928-s]